MSINNTYTPRNLQNAIREWLPDFQNPYALTLTYSDVGLSDAQRELPKRIGSNREEKWLTLLKSHLGKYLHRINSAIYKNAYKRYGKRIGCVPVLEGTGSRYRHHFHAYVDRPAFIEEHQFQALVEGHWLHGQIDLQKDIEGFWTKYITKLKSKNFSLDAFTDCLIVEHLTF